MQLIRRKVQDGGKGVAFFREKVQDGGKWRCPLKVTLEQIDRGTEEVIIRYRQMTDSLTGIVEYLEGRSDKLTGIKDGQQFLVNVPDILYLESVDGVTYFYTKSEVYKTAHTLALFETLYEQEGFFRCSKSTMLNIYRIRRLKSMSGHRIDAMMDNGEHIIISRHYAGALRNILKGEM